MPIQRVAIVAVMFCAVGLALVCIRNEQARCVADIQGLRLQRQQLRALLHQQQLQVARLRSPDRISERVSRLRLEVYAPAAQPAPTEYAAAGPYALAGE